MIIIGTLSRLFLIKKPITHVIRYSDLVPTVILLIYTTVMIFGVYFRKGVFVSVFSYFISFIIAILIWLFLGWIFSIFDHHYEEKKKGNHEDLGHDN